MPTPRSRVYRALVTMCLFLALLAPAPRVSAGGSEVQQMYGARYTGMGTTAIGFVDDAVAIYHNPAGLGHVERASVVGDLILYAGYADGVPRDDGITRRSDPIVAPLAFVGGAYRITEWLTAGLGAYPIAATGATYTFTDTMGVDSISKLTLFEFEIAPAIAFDIPDIGLRIGATYRISYGSFTLRDGTAAAPEVDMKASGWGYDGFSVGIQYQPHEAFQIGATYRGETSVSVDGRNQSVLGTTFATGGTTLRLPGRIGVGVRGDVGDFGMAADFEYFFNDVNEYQRFELGAAAVRAPTDWRNSIVFALGLEYRIERPKMAGTVRAGWLMDGQVTSRHYPSPFASAPTNAYVYSVGGGMGRDGWHVDAAFTIGNASTRITAADLSSGDLGSCVFCTGAGTYANRLYGIHLGGTYAFD